MPTVRCGALECVHNNGCSCTQNYIHMKTETVNGRYLWKCRAYERSEGFLDMLTILARNPKPSAEREDMRLKIITIDRSIADLVAANDGYCPCAVQRNEDTKCICREFREQDTPGPCHCGRYKKVLDD